MKFKLHYVLILIICFAVFAGVASMAADSRPAVVFDGKTNTFSFRNAPYNDVFASFKEIMPGQTKSQEIVLEGNNINETVSFYLRAESDAVDIHKLEPLTVTVYKDGTPIETNSGSNSLVNDVFLGTFSKNDKKVLTVELTVPTSVGNELADAQAGMRWVFTAQKDGGGIGAGTGAGEDTGVSDLLNTDDHIQYLFGYPDISFGQDRMMTRAEAAQMFYNLLREEIAEKSLGNNISFNDMKGDEWYAKAVYVMTDLGIVSGYPDGSYMPDMPITRAEFTTMAMKFANHVPENKNIFTDVNEGDWFYSYVSGANKYGWINGYPDGTFKPGDYIKRAEVTCIVNNMLDRHYDMDYINNENNDINSFIDLKNDYWAYYDIMEATNYHDYKKVDDGEEWISNSYS